MKKIKIMYIPSGFPGVYHYLDAWVVNAFNDVNHTCKHFNFFKGFDALQSAVLNFEPDLVLTMNGFVLPKEMTDYIRSKQITLAVWMTEDPYYMDTTVEIINRYDYVFTIERASRDYYLEIGHPHVYHLPLGTNPNIFSPSIHSNEEHTYDICFVGFPYPERIDLIKFLLKETPYTIHVVGGVWNAVFEEGNEERRLKITDWKPPHEVPDCYNSAKIILNTHRPHDLAENKNSVGVINRSINNRTFDIAACGVFQMTSFQPDLRDYFSEEEIVSFKNNEDLIQKIHFYLQNEQKRRQIAHNAREKILKHHTFVHRIKELISFIQNASK